MAVPDRGPVGAASGRLADRSGIDCVLVGDSAAMTVFGRGATTFATMEEILLLTRAARAGVSRPLLVADMPSELELFEANVQ